MENSSGMSTPRRVPGRGKLGPVLPEDHASLPSPLRLPKRSSVAHGDYVPNSIPEPSASKDNDNPVGDHQGKGKLPSIIHFEEKIPRGAEYLDLLHKEEMAIKAMIEAAEADSLTPGLHPDLENVLHVTTAHGRLLLNKVLTTFALLCLQNCEPLHNEAKVGNEDLAGAWDSMAPVVSKVKKMFEAIKGQRKRGAFKKPRNNKNSWFIRMG